jgi:hypothetical protein
MGGYLQVLGGKRLANMKQQSLQKGDKLFLHTDSSHRNLVHDICRRNYIRDQRALTSGSSSLTVTEVPVSAQVESISNGESAAVVEAGMTAYSNDHWCVEQCGSAISHHDCLSNIARLNGVQLVETVGGGDCFFDAIRHGLLDYDIERTVSELRLAAAMQLQMNADSYRPLYALEDYGLHQQAATFELFVDRTLNGTEWATQLTVAAMAAALNSRIHVVSTTTDANGRATAWEQDFADEVTDPGRMLVVGYNRQTAHYVSK